MKIKAIKDFYDLKAGVMRKTGDEFEVSAARAKELTTFKNRAGEILCIVLKKGAENGKA